MVFEKKYVNTSPDTSRRILTISLNDDEYKTVENLKALFDTQMDGQAIKLGMELGLCVIQSQLGGVLERYSFIKKRKK